jgi:hypothetical protein
MGTYKSNMMNRVFELFRQTLLPAWPVVVFEI